jgi:drug/metabolite transporter (DMT)-like permease
LSLAAATSNSFYFLLTRRLAGIDPAPTQQFFASAVPSACLAPFAFGQWVWPNDVGIWGLFVLIGGAGMIGHQAITVAHRFAPASVLAPFNYVLILYLTAASWFIFNQPPDHWILIGAAVVVGSGLYIWLRDARGAARASG